MSEASSSDADADYSLNRDSLKGFLDGKDIEPEIHYNENGGHSVPFWRAVFSEFLEAAMFGHVDVLQ